MVLRERKKRERRRNSEIERERESETIQQSVCLGEVVEKSFEGETVVELALYY